MTARPSEIAIAARCIASDYRLLPVTDHVHIEAAALFLISVGFAVNETFGGASPGARTARATANSGRARGGIRPYGTPCASTHSGVYVEERGVECRTNPISPRARSTCWSCKSSPAGPFTATASRNAFS